MLGKIFKFYNIPEKSKDEIYEFFNSVIGEKSSLKFSNPKNFNDPFEFNCVYKFRDHIKLKMIYAKYDYESKGISYEKWLELAEINYNSNIELVLNERRNMFNKFNICCLTRIETNPLMWSHYAYKHEGVCVEYDGDALIHFLKGKCRHYSPVSYEDEAPIVFYPKDDKIIRKVFFCKNKEWKYEEEFRIVRYGSEMDEFILIPKAVIKKVYIGAKARSITKSIVHEICMQNNIDIVYCKIPINSYKVEFEECLK